MAIYDWPATRAMLPQQADLRVVDDTQRSLISPMSGYVQTLGMPGARWGWSMEFGAQSPTERDAVEAFLLRLSGRQHRARLWDLKRPRPLGNIQTGGVTLGTTAGQFATTLQLAGCRPRSSLLQGGGFEVHAGGPASPWSSYSTGTTGTVSYGAGASLAGNGVYCQRITALNLGTTSADVAGLYQTIRGEALASRSCAFSITAAAYDGSPRVMLYLAWRAGLSIVDSSFSSVAPSATAARYTLLATAPPTADSVDVFVWMHSRSGSPGTAVVDIDDAQFEFGSAASPFLGVPTLSAGDWLGLANGQLVRVVTDAAATDLGAMTVDVRHMLRSAVASGTAVTLDRPTALYVRTEAGIALPRMAGQAAPPMSVEFVEAFA